MDLYTQLEFISKDVTHVQLPFVAPVLFPELLRIMVSEQVNQVRYAAAGNKRALDSSTEVHPHST